MNALAFFERFAPALAARYLASRMQVEGLKRLYEAAQPSQYHRARTHTHSADAVVDHAGHRLVAHARWLDENHDIAIGVLDCLVNRVVGTGLTPSPMLRLRNGALAEDANHALERLFRAWAKAPDTTGEYNLGELQRLTARALFRDGEVLQQHIQGGAFPHAGPVPFTLELLERDYLPMELIGREPLIVHGVEKGTGGRPVAYHLLREHPGDLGLSVSGRRDTVRIPAERIDHLKFARRLRQTRGVSIFHGVIRRLDDIKDYEESERIAARVAAAFTGFIRKSGDYANPAATGAARQMEMAPGQIFDNLLPGEEIGTIGSNRPNTGLIDFVHDQIRRVAAGTGTGASTVSRVYEGSYSAQRQEMVELEPGYARLHNYFVARGVVPVWQRFVETALVAGAFTLPRDVDPATLFDCEVARPLMPWIDPAKEVNADAAAVEAGFKSRHQVIRERYGDPRRTDAELAADRFTPAAPAASAAPAAGSTPAIAPDDEEAQAA